MKRWMTGCLIVFLVVLVAGGAAAYYFIGRPAMAAISAARDLGRIPQIEARVTQRATYQPPAGGDLDAQQVERYVAAARQVMGRLQDRMSVLDERHRELSRGGSNIGFRQAFDAWTDLIRLVVQAKEYQVEALNAHGFSLSEYAWVRSQVLAAAGHTVAQVDLAQLLANADDPTVRQQLQQVSQANIDMVAPYLQQLEDFVPLAVFGL